MPATYSVYGLGLRVNLPIAGLGGLAAAKQIDVCMSLGSMPPHLKANLDAPLRECYVSPELDECGEPEWRVFRLLESGDFRFVYSDGTIIVVDAQGSRVWATWPVTASVEDTATYLLGPILGLVLRLRGITCLHASAVAIGDQAIALVGPSGAGKSSTAAAFARLGYAVLAEDVAALSDHGDRFKVQPAYPRVRLWPAAVQSLFGSADALPRITPGWDKRFLDLNGRGFRFQRDPLPLAAVYLLGDCSAGQAMPIVETVSPKEGLMTLVSDTYATRYLDRSQRAQEFDLLGRLVAKVPLRRVNPRADMARIPELCEAILADFQRLTPCAV